MKRLLILIPLIALSGCVSAEKLAKYEKLGIVEAEVQGKFSNTDYGVEEKNGERVATLTHSNAWFPKIRFVRKTPIEKVNP